jgi:hypothetical protein
MTCCVIVVRDKRAPTIKESPMPRRTASTVVNFENYASRLRTTSGSFHTSRMRQEHLPLLSPLLTKAERLEKLNPKLAAVIERLVDDMLDEIEGRRP